MANVIERGGVQRNNVGPHSGSEHPDGTRAGRMSLIEEFLFEFALIATWRE